MDKQFNSSWSICDDMSCHMDVSACSSSAVAHNSKQMGEVSKRNLGKIARGRHGTNTALITR
jgi:hypothetical protein